LEAESADPTLPIRLGKSISAEAFDPPIFAALCSANFNIAVRRISRYKKLIAPMALHVDEGKENTTLELEWLDTSIDPPTCLVATELVFFVQLARLATRAEVHPLEVATPRPPSPAEAYAAYFGVDVQASSAHRLVFSAEDAARPFLTANEKMWQFFEPELQKRLSELDVTATMTERVRASLLELLPSGSASVDAVSKKLGVSSRTLQRRLSTEGGSFQTVLNRTREELARYYLKSSAMSGAEISFLLGFEDPNSFFRAFHTWTGETPERVRTTLRAQA
jgi:AraC-like DNA-binding protein